MGGESERRGPLPQPWNQPITWDNLGASARAAAIGGVEEKSRIELKKQWRGFFVDKLIKAGAIGGTVKLAGSESEERVRAAAVKVKGGGTKLIENMGDLNEVVNTNPGKYELDDTRLKRLRDVGFGIMDNLQEVLPEEGNGRKAIAERIAGLGGIFAGIDPEKLADKTQIYKRVEVSNQKTGEKVKQPDRHAAAPAKQPEARNKVQQEGGSEDNNLAAAIRDLRDAIKNGGLGNESSEAAERRRRLEEMQLEDLQFKGDIEEVSEEEWLDGLKGKDYEKAQIPARWMYRAPDWMERNGRSEAKMLSEWRSLYGLAEGLSYAVVRRRTDGDFQTDSEYIKNKIMGMYKFSEGKLKKLYEAKDFEYGFRGALEALVDDLFVYDSSLGIFVFKENSKSVDLFMNDSFEYKQGLAENLCRRGVCVDVKQALVMVSIASDFLEMGGQYEVGDSNRSFGDASDALRTALRPDVKFGKKMEGGELWGGPIGIWAMTVAGHDPVRAKALIEKYHMTPKLLGGSVLNMMVEVEGGRDKIPLGKALMERKSIKFEKTSKDFYLDWKKDHVMNAIDVYTYLTGGKKLEFRSLTDLSNVISDWVKSGYNAILALRKVEKKTGLNLVSREIVAGMVAGSTTVWPFEPIYLRIDKSDEAINNPSFYDNYIDASTAIIQAIAQSTDERVWLMDFFGVDKKGAKDLFKKAVDYDYITNGTININRRLALQRKRNWHILAE